MVSLHLFLDCDGRLNGTGLVILLWIKRGVKQGHHRIPHELISDSLVLGNCLHYLGKVTIDNLD